MSLCRFLRLQPTKRACGQVGDLELVCPNVRRYKLLMFSYLQMYNRFPVRREQKYKRIPNVQLLPSAPIATNPCWRFVLLCPRGSVCQFLGHFILSLYHFELVLIAIFVFLFLMSNCPKSKCIVPNLPSLSNNYYENPFLVIELSLE